MSGIKVSWTNFWLEWSLQWSWSSVLKLDFLFLCLLLFLIPLHLPLIFQKLNIYSLHKFQIILHNHSYKLILYYLLLCFLLKFDKLHFLYIDIFRNYYIYSSFHWSMIRTTYDWGMDYWNSNISSIRIKSIVFSNCISISKISY